MTNSKIDSFELDTKNRSQLVWDIISTNEFQRIRSVSFLGLYDFLLKNKHRSSKSRADHSFGVLVNSLNMIQYGELSDNDVATVIAVSLCHDLGHSPLSHSLEHPLKHIDNSLSHRHILDKILQKESSQIREVLLSHDIDIKRVSRLANKFTSDPLNWIFHNSFNVDTLDGIERALAPFGITEAFDKHAIINSLCEIREGNIAKFHINIEEFDKFWIAKSFFYERIATSSWFSRAEEIFARKILEKKKTVCFNDFFSTDMEFISKNYATLDFDHDFKYDCSEIPERFSRYRSTDMTKFEINLNTEVKNFDDIEKRYIRKSKFGRSKSFPAH